MNTQLSFARDMPRDLTAAIWAAFWLLVLTAGEPDLLGALVALIERIG